MKIDELIFGFNISLFTASCILIVLWLAIKTYCERMPKKSFIKETPTNILITGGAQGIGKLLAEKFASSSEIGSVNLIVCDIREDLGKEMIADVKKASGETIALNGIIYGIFLAAIAALYVTMSVGRSVCRSVCLLVGHQRVSKSVILLQNNFTMHRMHKMQRIQCIEYNA